MQGLRNELGDMLGDKVANNLWSGRPPYEGCVDLLRSCRELDAIIKEDGLHGSHCYSAGAMVCGWPEKHVS